MRIGTCHIVVRRTLDWERASYDQLISPFIQETAALWDRTFRLTYTACRAGIKRVAQAAHRELSNVRILEPSCPSAVDLAEIGARDIVLLCDDDDWYHPETVARLAAVDELATKVVVWPDGVFGYFAPKQNITRAAGLPRLRLRARTLEEPASGFLVKTNNYAVSGALVRRQPRLLEAIWNHGNGGADEYIRTGRVDIAKLSTPLSVANRHPCSQLEWASKHIRRTQDVFHAAVGRVAGL